MAKQNSKPIPLKMRSSIKKVTVKMPISMKAALPATVIGQGYNMRQKSQWVAEAIRSLLSGKEWEGALVSEMVSKVDSQDVFSLPSDVVALIASEIRRVSEVNLSLNANQSTIIRAAINRRTLGFFKKVG
tara:strand:+ start:5228 stop:5617 length:390 start_codon:yes stop_codon:yes gene_type:complete